MPTSKNDADVESLFNILAAHFKSRRDVVRCAFIPADTEFRAMARVHVRNRLFVLLADGIAFTFTELRSTDKDYTINNGEELIHTIDEIIAGWQPSQ